MKPALPLALLAALAACAKSPDAIAPVSMGAAYAGHDCAATARDLTTERTALAALEKQQRSAASGDALGVFLLGIPMSSLTGGDKAGDIATSKGKIAALEARAATCRGA